jgi:hypothetical protein
LVDLERLKGDDKWLSDAHVTFSLLYVPFFFLFCLYLNDVVIVFEIVRAVGFGEARRSNFWTLCFGLSCLRNLKNSMNDTEVRSICWIVILLSCPCVRSKPLAFF